MRRRRWKSEWMLGEKPAPLNRPEWHRDRSRSCGVDLQRLVRLLALRRRVDDHVRHHGHAVEVVAAERVRDRAEQRGRRAALHRLADALRADGVLRVRDVDRRPSASCDGTSRYDGGFA